MSKYFIILSVFVSNILIAQNLKIGYVYEDYIIANFSETKNLQEEIKRNREQLTSQLKEKSNLYQEKYATYQSMLQNVTNTTSEALNGTLKEIQTLREDFEQSRQKGEAEIRQVAQSKFLEIQEKVRKAIKLVSVEKGYPYIIRKNINPSGGESTSVLLYSAHEKQDDLTDAVLIKLGSTPPKK
jgi:outer membrane protein